MKLSGAALCSFVLLGCATSRAPASHDPPGVDPAVASAPQASSPIAARQDNPMLERAMALYAAQDYRAAAEAFQTAYGAEASPSLLLAQAQALRMAGDCESALPLYERFLEQQTDPTYTNAVRPIMEACLDEQASSESAVARKR